MRSYDGDGRPAAASMCLGGGNNGGRPRKCRWVDRQFAQDECRSKAPGGSNIADGKGGRPRTTKARSAAPRNRSSGQGNPMTYRAAGDEAPVRISDYILTVVRKLAGNAGPFPSRACRASQISAGTAISRR